MLRVLRQVTSMLSGWLGALCVHVRPAKRGGLEGGMLAVDAGEEPVAKEEVELLLDPKVFRCRWCTVGVKFDGLQPATTADRAKTLAVAVDYLMKRGPSSLRGAAGRLLEA